MDWQCPCDQCNGRLEPPWYDIDPLELGVLTWDPTLPETMCGGTWVAQQLWPGIPFPKGP